MVAWNGSEARASYGMEIEQTKSNVPSDVHGMDYGDSGTFGGWHTDGSGPIETDLGPYKLAKSLAKKFVRETRAASGSDTPWTWTAANNRVGSANGNGSHVHYELNNPDGISDDEVKEAWTIAYNTIVELTPLMAPFFCHDWVEGFRSGTNYSYGGETNVGHYAEKQTTRLSQDSVWQKVRHGHASRSYDAVTWNGSDVGGKPLTLELRLNDAHPSIAMVGLSMMKKLVVEAIERGWSVKTANGSLDYNWEAAYAPATSRFNLFTTLGDSPSVEFHENRGIPRLEGQSFDSALDALVAVIESFSPKAGSWRDRVMNQWIHETATGPIEVESVNPHNCQESLWTLLDDDWVKPVLP